MSTEDLLSDIMAESSSPSTTNNPQSQAEIEDEIAVYDSFLLAHKKPPEVETASGLPPDFVIPQMNTVPSQGQLSALSDATPPMSGKGQPTGSNSTSPTPQFPTALGTTVEQPEEVRIVRGAKRRQRRPWTCPPPPPPSRPRFASPLLPTFSFQL